MYGGSRLNIPVVDISNLDQAILTGHTIVEAAIEFGFIFIKSTGLGIQSETIDGMFELVSRSNSTSILQILKGLRTEVVPKAISITLGSQRGVQCREECITLA